MIKPRVRVIVEALGTDPDFELHVEPWGETFDVSPGAKVVVTFVGPSTDDPPTVDVSRGPSHMVLCADDGLEDYRVEDAHGQPLNGR